MANITVKSQKSSTKKTFTASVSTYGELKQAFADNNIDYDGQKVVLKNTGAVLEYDSAVLPQEDLVIFIFPDKVKAGGKLSRAIEAMQADFNEKMEQLINAVERIADATEQGEIIEEDQDDFYEGDPLTDEDLEDMENFQ